MKNEFTRYNQNLRKRVEEVGYILRRDEADTVNVDKNMYVKGKIGEDDR